MNAHDVQTTRAGNDDRISSVRNRRSHRRAGRRRRLQAPRVTQDANRRMKAGRCQNLLRSPFSHLGIFLVCFTALQELRGKLLLHFSRRPRLGYKTAMATLTIDLPADAERRLREEAGRRNASVEDYAARLIVNQLDSRAPAEFEIGDDEVAAIQQAVREVRVQPARP